MIGVILNSREAARRMAKSRGGSGGVIVNISSTGTKLGNPNQWVHYAATKGAIETFTNGLARELAVEGIRVAAISPGLTLTDPTNEAGILARLATMKGEIPLARAGSVDEVAEGVYWLCSDAASYCTGVGLPIAGGRCLNAEPKLIARVPFLVDEAVPIPLRCSKNSPAAAQTGAHKKHTPADLPCLRASVVGQRALMEG